MKIKRIEKAGSVFEFSISKLGCMAIFMKICGKKIDQFFKIFLTNRGKNEDQNFKNWKNEFYF